MRFLLSSQLLLLSFFAPFYRLQHEFCIEARNNRRTPEPSSTLLRLHRLYHKQPPHDTSLYDTLNVSPNATSAEITKSYRKLCRRFHPDKTTDAGAASAQQQLERVRTAYDVLKDDRTRLRYHRHGVLNVRDVVAILMGQATGSSSTSTSLRDNPDMQALLQLMGYHHDQRDTTSNHYHSHFDTTMNGDASRTPIPTTSPSISRYDRVQYIATHLYHVLQPVLDGRLSPTDLRDTWMHQCDRLKRLPLGAQILRCVGRAYRSVGQQRHWARVLRQQVSDVATAAWAGGRVLWKEQKIHWRRGGDTKEGCRPADDYDAVDADDDLSSLFGRLDANSNTAPTDEEIRRKEEQKADEALLESLQIQALWQIRKIELHRTVREACELLLQESSKGCVHERTGVIVEESSRREQIATLLVLLGETMISQSKENTAWMDGVVLVF